MKILFLLLLVFFIFPIAAFAIEYPEIMNNGTIFINTGIGFGTLMSGDHARKCPPITFSFDTATPIMGLPLTLGLITGYFSTESMAHEGFYYMPIGARIAYHKNFFSRLPRFDSYAILTLGGAIPFPKNPGNINLFWVGLSIGSRYFFLAGIGAYIEIGIDRVQIITFGLTFRI